jgi:hypothetical protein
MTRSGADLMSDTADLAERIRRAASIRSQRVATRGMPALLGPTLTDVTTSLTSQGYWLAPLGYNSHPFTRQGTPQVAPGDFSQAFVGDETDTSPYPDPNLRGISTEAYVRNMSVLIRGLSPQSSSR